MARKANIKDVLANGTPKQKALLIIENEEASVRQEGAFLTDAEVRSIINSARKNEAEYEELRKYLRISEKYQINRFRIYGLQENIKKLSARFAYYCQIWELAEQQAEFCNTLLGLIDDSNGGKGIRTVSRKEDVERYIYSHCRGWSRYAPIKRTKDADGNKLRDVEVDLTHLHELMKDVIEEYSYSLGIAKSLVIASDSFVTKYRASAFIPGDVKDAIQYLKSPKLEVPEIYRRDSYLKLLEAKGEKDREVQYRAKYALLPAWDEVEPIGLDNAKNAFSL
jgi:hypothetical protein